MFVYLDSKLLNPSNKVSKGYKGITLSMSVSVQMSGKYNSSLTDEPILMKLERVALIQPEDMR